MSEFTVDIRHVNSRTNSAADAAISSPQHPVDTKELAAAQNYDPELERFWTSHESLTFAEVLLPLSPASVRC